MIAVIFGQPNSIVALAKCEANFHFDKSKKGSWPMLSFVRNKECAHRLVENGAVEYGITYAIEHDDLALLHKVIKKDPEVRSHAGMNGIVKALKNDKWSFAVALMNAGAYPPNDVFAACKNASRADKDLLWKYKKANRVNRPAGIKEECLIM